MAATRPQRIGATLILTLAAAAMFDAGCERRDENAAKIQAEMNAAKTAQPAPAAATRPSTQQLLEGRTKRIALVVVPLTAEVPESWQVKTLDVSDSIGPSSSAP